MSGLGDHDEHACSVAPPQVVFRVKMPQIVPNHCLAVCADFAPGPRRVVRRRLTPQPTTSDHRLRDHTPSNARPVSQAHKQGQRRAGVVAAGGFGKGPSRSACLCCNHNNRHAGRETDTPGVELRATRRRPPPVRAVCVVEIATFVNLAHRNKGCCNMPTRRGRAGGGSA